MNPIPHRGTFPCKGHRTMAQVIADEERAAFVDRIAEQKMRDWKRRQDKERYQRERVKP